MVRFSTRSLWKWEISQQVMLHVNPCCCGFIVIKSSCYPSVIIPCIKQVVEFQPVVPSVSPYPLAGTKHILTEQTIMMETPIFPLSPLAQVSWPNIQNISVGFQNLSIKDVNSGTVHSLEVNENELSFCRHSYNVIWRAGVVEECHQARLWIRTISSIAHIHSLEICASCLHMN